MQRDEDLEKSLLSSGQYVETAQSAWVTSSYPISSVSWAGSTKFCDQLVLGTSPTYGKFLATDGELQSTSNDEAIYHEHLVHPAIVAYRALYGTSRSLRVLVLGAGEGATIRELSKYDKSTISYILWNDIDEELVHLCEKYLGYVSRDSEMHAKVYNDPSRCERRYEDACKVLKEASEPYDVVICDLPDPVLEGDIFGLYSPEFWRNMAAQTADNCVVSTHTGPIGASKNDMATNLWLQGLVQENGFSKPLAGKASIPSFLTEWGFIVFTKNTPLSSYPGGWEQHLPSGCEVLEQSALDSFFAIPNYYYTRK